MPPATAALSAVSDAEMPPPPPPPPPPPAADAADGERRCCDGNGTTALNVLLLGLAWALAASGLFIQISNTSLFVNALRPGTALATVPLALFFLVAATSLFPLSLIARRTGRAPVFLASTALAAAGAALQLGAAFVAASSNSSTNTLPPLAMLSIGAALQGFSFSTSNNYRFVAAEFVDAPDLRPRAISLVVSCAVLAALLGPEASRRVALAVPGVPYAGSYAYLLALYGAQMLTLVLVDWRLLARKQQAHAAAAAKAEAEAEAARKSDVAKQPLATAAEAGATTTPTTTPAAATPSGARSYSRLLLTRDFLTASACCAGAFASMAALMALTPLRVVSKGLGSELAYFVVVAHIAAMYLPALLMGDAVKFFGIAPVLVAGFATLAAGTLAFLSEQGGQASYYAGMVLIGVGWSGAYVSASSLAASCYASEPPARRFPIQAATDSCVLFLSGVAMGTSTPLLRAPGFGWQGIIGLYTAANALMALVGAWWGIGRWMEERRRTTTR